MCEFRENPLEGFRELTVLNWTPFMKIVYSETAQTRVWGSPRLEFWLLYLPGEWSWASHRMVLSLSSSSEIPPNNLVGIEWLMQMSGTILITDLMLNKFYSFFWILPSHSSQEILFSATSSLHSNEMRMCQGKANSHSMLELCLWVGFCYYNHT